jgi:hypothetical protein
MRFGGVDKPPWRPLQNASNKAFHGNLHDLHNLLIALITRLIRVYGL